MPIRICVVSSGCRSYHFEPHVANGGLTCGSHIDTVGEAAGGRVG